MLTFESSLTGWTLRTFWSCYGQAILAIFTVEAILSIASSQTVLAIGARTTRNSVKAWLPGYTVTSIETCTANTTSISLGSAWSWGTYLANPVYAGCTGQTDITAISFRPWYAR